MDFNLIHLKTVDSTNDYAKRNHKDLKTPFLIISDTQTAGRGTFGKKFYSPQDKGLYMTLVLKSDISIMALQDLNMELGHLISDYLNLVYKIESKAVYPNDIMVENRKLVGILSEATLKNSHYEFIYIGIGINIFKANYPEDIKDIAISLDALSNKKIKPVSLAKDLALEILRMLKKYEN